MDALSAVVFVTEMLDVAIFVHDLARSGGDTLLSESEGEIAATIAAVFLRGYGRRLLHLAFLHFFKTEARTFRRRQA